MSEYVRERSINVARYVIKYSATVRQAGKAFGISKSTAHKDITERLQKINYALYLNVQEILQQHKAERHIRGGMATRAMYAKQKKH